MDDSMTKMLRIAQHPVLRHHVHSLLFLNAVLDAQYMDYDEWEDSIGLRKPPGVPLDPYQEQGNKVPRFNLEGDDIMSLFPPTPTIKVTQERLNHHHKRFQILFWAQCAILKVMFWRRLCALRLRTSQIYENSRFGTAASCCAIATTNFMRLTGVLTYELSRF